MSLSLHLAPNPDFRLTLPSQALKLSKFVFQNLTKLIFQPCSCCMACRWTLPFPGADASVIRRSQAAIQASGEPPVSCSVRFTLTSRYYVFKAMLVGAAMAVLARFSWGRFLLLRFPELFTYGLASHAGPSQQQMETTRFEVTLIGKGYRQGPPSNPKQKPDREIVARVSGPDPGYLATSTMLVQVRRSLESALSSPLNCFVQFIWLPWLRSKEYCLNLLMATNTPFWADHLHIENTIFINFKLALSIQFHKFGGTQTKGTKGRV